MASTADLCLYDLYCQKFSSRHIETWMSRSSGKLYNYNFSLSTALLIYEALEIEIESSQMYLPLRRLEGVLFKALLDYVHPKRLDRSKLWIQ